MKGLTRLQSLLCLGAISLATVWTTRADLFIFWPGFRFQYDEHSGALINEAPRDEYTESIDAATVGPDGDFYVTGNTLGWGSVFRLDGATGAYKSTFVPDADGVTTPKCIQFGPDGDLYVSGGNPHVTPNDTYDSHLIVRRYHGKTGAPKGYFLDSSANLHDGGAFAFSPDGNVYIQNGDHEIARFNAAGAFIDVFYSRPGLGIANFQFGADENVYVLFASNIGHVYRIDRNTGVVSDFIDAIAAGMRGPRKMLLGPDGDIYLGDMDVLDVWRFDGKTGASKGVFVKGEVPRYGDGWINSMVFSGPRVSISHGKSGPCVKWPNTFGNFELQSRAGLDAPWQTVTDATTMRGCTLNLELTSSSDNLIFRLIKR